MITDSFDIKSNAIIGPENLYGERAKICDICIITYSSEMCNKILEEFKCKEVAAIHSANGANPIYLLEYKGIKIAFYVTMIGSSAAGACLEEARCLIGAKKYIMFGTSGSLDSAICEGKVIVPTAAYRDEGTSYHYAEPSDYIEIKNHKIVADFLKKNKIPYVEGKTWTTDGFYRETENNMKKRKSEGCIAVEMECSAIQAICDFRKLELYDFLISGDLLDSSEWEERILGGEEEINHQLKNFCIALELAVHIGDV